MLPEYDFGDEVRLVKNVRNDGSYPGKRRGELLLKQGALGHVRDVGVFLQDQLIYQVHFFEQGKTVGCRAEELIAAGKPWLASIFEQRQRVISRLFIPDRSGRLYKKDIHCGDEGWVVNVIRDVVNKRIHYLVDFSGRHLQLPEAALLAAKGSANYCDSKTI
ncbi:nitrogen fixation protein NifZ [Agaribacterium haliotis]|uniref:nitrogen fixation protein NifZ n=1 Tax=Agaribacterium haliotis TaxID=2013869 RepID=UPI001956FD77|nr:nitrogen fixation protein NifZ [Agaribacterium haliotis]